MLLHSPRHAFLAKGSQGPPEGDLVIWGGEEGIDVAGVE